MQSPAKRCHKPSVVIGRASLVGRAAAPGTPGDCAETTVQKRGREACLARRFTSHKSQAVRDPTSCPLYRNAGANLDGYKIVWTRTVEWDDERRPLALRLEEEHVRSTLNHVFSLHNVNRAIDPNQRRREYMKRWRIAHGQGTADSYMARKARERREAIQNVANALETNDNDT
eukprot:COSAG02_NODE_18_length_54986_cov_345.599322_28_plen_173_part_00